MAQYHGRKTKLGHMKKKKSDLGSDPRKPKFDEVHDVEVRTKVKMLGGKEKIAAVKVKFANVSMPDGKTKKVQIKMVEDNPANKDFRRENVVSLGGTLDTEIGKVKITSRPGQDGVVNAILLK